MTNSRVLYLDDECDLLDLASSFFEDENISLDTVDDFHRALEMFKTNSYDLVITDAKLPTGSGLEFIKILREEFKFEGKIILVTGSLLAESVKDSKHDLTFHKPINFLELVDKIKELIF